MDTKRINNVSFVAELIYDGYCEKEDAAPITKALALHTDLLLLLCKNYYVEVYRKKTEQMQKTIGIFRNANIETFPSLRSIRALKCHLHDHIVQNVSRLGVLVYVVDDQFESSHKLNKPFY